MDLFQWLKSAGQPPARVPGDSGAPPVRKRYHFTGLVQGVGFRWEARLLAQQLGLTGWVRNEGDGTVTVEVQGGPGAIGDFLRSMQAVPRFDVTDIRAEDLPLSGGEAAYSVRY